MLKLCYKNNDRRIDEYYFDLNFDICVYVNDEDLIFYSLPDQHIKPDIEVILEEMDDVRRQQETQKNYKEWKKQNQHNETNPE